MTAHPPEAPEQWRARRPALRLRFGAMATGLVLLAAGAGAVVAAFNGAGAEPSRADALPPATATVVRATLTETTTVDGTLGYGPAVALTNRLSGTVTGTAPGGAVVERGQPLYSVHQRPVVLLYGPVPAYRPLQPGVAGDDVRQLEENLRELGYTGFTVDGAYTAATAGAVARWQRDLRLPQTGVVELGTVAYLSGPVRIADIELRPGQTASPDVTVLSYTGTVRTVTAAVEASQLPMVGEGAGATVTLPGRSQVPATVVSVGRVATPGDDRPAGPPSNVGSRPQG